MPALYRPTDKMSDLICDAPELLQMMSRFGLSLGVGEKTVAEVCDDAGVDATTFIAVANFVRHGESTAEHYADKVSVPALISYLKQAHDYFLGYRFPAMRRKLLEAIDCSGQGGEVPLLIIKFFDEYLAETRAHMKHEERRVFTYVQALLEGRLPDDDFRIAIFASSHTDVDRKLQELKNIIIRYYTPASGMAERLSSVLFDIFICEDDLRCHCHLEDRLFVPAVRLLEDRVEREIQRRAEEGDDGTSDDDSPADALSQREIEIVKKVVEGLTNKEIAEQLFISINTVVTHRKNISRKLNIHSISGLTIYAIVNNLVDLESLPRQ